MVGLSSSRTLLASICVLVSIINVDSLTRRPIGIIIIVRAAFGTCHLKKGTVFEQLLKLVVHRKWQILKLTVFRKWRFLKLVVLGREVTPLSTLKTFLLEPPTWRRNSGIFKSQREGRKLSLSSLFIIINNVVM